MQALNGQPHLMDYLQVVSKRKWLFIACFLATVGTVIVSDYLAKPVYRATATIDINRDPSGSVLKTQSIDFNFSGTASEAIFLNSHYEMMTSRPVLLNVVKALHWDQTMKDKEGESNHGGVEGGWEGVADWIQGKAGKIIPDFLKPGKEEELQQDPQDRLVDLANYLKTNITIIPVKDTRLAEIQVEDSDPSLAMKIANTLSEIYIEYDFHSNLEATQKMFALLSAQLLKMRNEMSESQQSIYSFWEKRKISPAEGQKVQSKNIDELNDLYLKVKTDRMSIESRIMELRRIEKGGEFGESIPTITESGMLQSLTKDLIEAQIEFSQLREVTTTKHPLLDPPEMASKKARISLIKKEIQKELSRAIDNLSVEKAILENREKVLASAITEVQGRLLRASKVESQYVPLEQEAKADKDLYDLLVVKLKEANIGQGMRQASIRIIEPALLPKKPVKPRKMLNLILGIIVGLVFGGGSVFFLEYLDRTIRTPEEVERYLALPLLCTVPKVSMKGLV